MSVASIDAILVLIAPQYASTSQPTREVFINMAIAQVGKFTCSETVRDLATANLAAHMMTMSSRAAGGGGGSGPITSETEGSLSRSYAAAGGGQYGPTSVGLYGATPYGAEFMRLVSTFVLPVLTRQVVADVCE